MAKFFIRLTALAALTTSIVLAAIYFVGPKADIAAVQAAEHKIVPVHDHVIGIHVIDNYALLLSWSGTSFDPNLEGDSAFKRISGEQWKPIYVHYKGDQCIELVHRGVPASIAHELCTGWGDVGS